MSKVLFIPVASPLHDPLAVSSILNEYRRCLESLIDAALPLITSYNQLDCLRIDENALIIVSPLTGGTEHIVERIFVKISDHGFLLLTPHPMMNSLPAALEIFSALRGSGRAWIIVEWPPGPRIEKFVRVWRVIQEIGGMRIGLIGESSPWLVYSSGANIEEKLKEIFRGLTFVRINLEELYREIGEVDDHSLHNILYEIERRARAILVPRDEIEKSLRVYLALRRIFKAHHLDAASIRCFDLIEHINATACLAASIFNCEMRILGCEGDLPALITMLLFSKLSNSPAFMGNLVWIEDDVIVMAHCSAPLAVLESFDLDTHYESNRGVATGGRFAEGQLVTLGRLDPTTRTLRYAIGRISEQIARRNACRTQVSVKISGRVNAFIEEPIGNHYVMVSGDISEELNYAARIARLKIEDVTMA